MNKRKGGPWPAFFLWVIPRAYLARRTRLRFCAQYADMIDDDVRVAAIG